jgi:hypothetical protein
MQSQSLITLGEPGQSNGSSPTQKGPRADAPEAPTLDPTPNPTQTNKDGAPGAKAQKKDNKFKRGLKGVAYGFLGIIAFPLLFCALLCGMNYNNGGFPENSLWKRFTRVVTLKKLRGKGKRPHA